MRLCFHCLRWRAGDSPRCPYCGLGRSALCSAGHENPPDANVCGTCGRGDLSPAAPPPRSLRVLRVVFKLTLWLIIIIFGFSLIQGMTQAVRGGMATPFILAIAFLLVALNVCSRVLGFKIGKAIVRLIWKLFSRKH
ncbi:hypothetical protein TRIP_C20335 [Candidatus Zixiibacteriota bacterium]|nr:hypothetical protein TRIP_C20335 [candidate division Zixibacteria bacterium]